MSAESSRAADQPAFRRLPRAVREQQMLDAAVSVFSRRGFHSASVDEIAEVAGISKPMVYAYLGTKEELFIACLHREGARLIEAIAVSATRPGADGSLDSRLWRGLRAFFRFVASHREGWSVLYRQARGQEPFVDVLAQMRQRMVDLVDGMLSDVSDVSHACGVDCALLANALVGGAEGVADWLVSRDGGDPDELATQLMGVVWVGVGALLRGESWQPRADASTDQG